MSEESKQPDIAAIKARLAAATPGPWEWHYGNEFYNTDHLVSMADGLGTKDPVICNFGNNSYEEPRSGIVPDDNDQDLIAHAPTDIAALLALVERQGQALTGQDREIRRLNDEIDRYRSELGYEE